MESCDCWRILIDEFCNESKIIWDNEIKGQIIEQTEVTENQIVAVKGRTDQNISTNIYHLADTVINQQLAIVSVSSVLMDDYGGWGVALFVSSVDGLSGYSREKWTSEEYRGFFDAVEKMRETLASIKEG